MEFKNLKFITQYEEIDQINNKNTLKVILKSDDQHFIKLTNRTSYTGSNKLSINYFNSLGTWSSQRDKCDGNNLKLRIPQKEFFLIFSF